MHRASCVHKWVADSWHAILSQVVVNGWKNAPVAMSHSEGNEDADAAFMKFDVLDLFLFWQHCRVILQCCYTDRLLSWLLLVDNYNLGFSTLYWFVSVDYTVGADYVKYLNPNGLLLTGKYGILDFQVLKGKCGIASTSVACVCNYCKGFDENSSGRGWSG